MFVVPTLTVCRNNLASVAVRKPGITCVPAVCSSGGAPAGCAVLAPGSQSPPPGLRGGGGGEQRSGLSGRPGGRALGAVSSV